MAEKTNPQDIQLQQQQHPYSPQQQQTTTTTVVTRDVTSRGGTVHVITGNREWHANLYGCKDDCRNCVCVYFCTLCQAAVLARRLGENCCIPCFVPGGLTALRTKVRLMLGIKGTICSDCCASTFCALCVMCQMKRELDAVNWP